jgi:AraC family transcriptional regulator, regulatory protein of adaptative response / DNA-3-methyladenine glycosylase II
LPAIILRIRRLFDLGADPVAIGAALSRDAHLAPLVAARPGLRLPGAWDAFEIAVRAMLGQQITVKAATRLGGKLVAALGTPIGESAIKELTHGFPRPDQFDLQIVAGLGMPRTRAEALAALATAAVAEPNLLQRRGDLDEAVEQLRRLPGVGEWTAQYIAMRALRESDAFLAGDVAVQRAFAVAGRRPKPRELLARAEAWRPWRAYAVLHLWMAEPAPERTPIKENANALAA